MVTGLNITHTRTTTIPHTRSGFGTYGPRARPRNPDKTPKVGLNEFVIVRSRGACNGVDYFIWSGEKHKIGYPAVGGRSTPPTPR